MNRYSKYFLQNALWLDDGFCEYYLQDENWGRPEILDVSSVIFNWPEEALQWLNQCAAYDSFSTLRRLRAYLANHSSYLSLHTMSDHQVLKAAARQISRNALQLVIKPKLGWAVQVNEQTAEPIQPIRTEPEPDLGSLLDQVKTELDALVIEQKKLYAKHEAAMAGMSDTEKAQYYAQHAGGAVYDSAIGDTIGLVGSAAMAAPGFFKGYLKILWKVAQAPSKMAQLTARAIAEGNMNPIKDEIDKIVDPLAKSLDQALEYKSMLTVLLNEPLTHDMLYDFAGRYWDATHPIERTKMGASAISDVVVTVILAIVSAGVGAVANIAAKSGRLVKVAKLLKKIATVIRRISPDRKLLNTSRKAGKKSAAKVRNARKAGKPTNKGVPKVEKPKDVDKLREKGYSDDLGNRGPKTTPRTGVGATGQGIPKERVKPDVLKEVHPDSKAAYGYSPNKGTAYEKVDFTDVDAAKKNRGIRTEYLDGSKRLENDIKTMRAKGSSSEEIGRHVVNERNLQKVDARKHMKPDEIKVLEERNLKKYDNPIGPTADDIFEGTKENLIDKGLYESDAQVWDHVIEKSMKKDDVINTLLGIEH